MNYTIMFSFWVSSGFSGFLPPPKTYGWIGNSKLPLGVSVCECVWVWWRHIQDIIRQVFLPCALCFWDRLQIPHDPDQDKVVTQDNWMTTKFYRKTQLVYDIRMMCNSDRNLMCIYSWLSVKSQQEFSCLKQRHKKRIQKTSCSEGHSFSTIYCSFSNLQCHLKGMLQQKKKMHHYYSFIPSVLLSPFLSPSGDILPRTNAKWREIAVLWLINLEWTTHTHLRTHMHTCCVFKSSQER